ncbi:hypothetical protein, partial [Kitasatospora sp. NPDC057541]|uniref:hypothetical protein n=1 Tax=Kitasatospora sp. NPDC057541 TaxID=3346161 RepID=UPI00367CA97F
MLDLDEITAKFQATADYASTGKVNHRWLGALPEQVAALAREWELEIGSDIGTDFTARVSAVLLPCTGPRGAGRQELAPPAHPPPPEVAHRPPVAP